MKVKKKRLEAPQIVAIVILLIVLLGAEWYLVKSFAQGEQRRHNQTIMQQIEADDARKYNEDVKVTKQQVGNTTFVVSYPMDVQGQVIVSVQEELDKQLETLKVQYAQESKQTWVYLKAYQVNILKNLNDVYYYVSVYQEEGVSLTQIDYKELSHQLITTDGTMATGAEAVASIFVNALEINNAMAKKAITLASEKNMTTDQKNTFVASFSGGNWKKQDVSLIENGICVTANTPITLDNGESVAKLTFTYEELFPIMKKDMIPESLQDAYRVYQENVEKRLHEKRVAITFDDGPSALTTPHILDTLKEFGVHATFFIMGQHVSGNEELIQRMVQEGHQLANHSYSHPLLTTLTSEEIHEQVSQTQDIIANASGGIRPTLLRPPYGGFDKTVADQAGIAIVNWSVDSLDWKSRDAVKVYQEITDHAYDGAIILMHDIHEDTMKALADVIQTLQADGYAVGSVDELMAEQPLEAGYVYFDRTQKEAIE